MLDVIMPIVQTGAVGGMLIMVWRWSVSKDKDNYGLIKALNKERKEMYENMSELVREVTTALAYKNVTDDKMSTAVDKLAEQQRELRHALKDLQKSDSDDSPPNNLPWNKGE